MIKLSVKRVAVPPLGGFIISLARALPTIVTAPPAPESLLSSAVYSQ
jgi:hypothetical protein